MWQIPEGNLNLMHGNIKWKKNDSEKSMKQKNPQIFSLSSNNREIIILA